MMPLDLPPQRGDIDRFITADGAGAPWLASARERYAFDMGSALKGALADLGLERGRVAFDDMGLGFRLGLEGVEIADGYDPLMFARAVKTEPEMRLLERSTRLNEAAIRRTIAAWQPGATWRDLNRAYARRWRISAASCAIRAAWCGAIRAAPIRRSRCRPGSRTTK